jgi:hypothetical protein
MIDPQKLLPILKPSMPKASDAQIMEAINKLAKAHPELSNTQALAALQKFMQEKKSPTMGNLARTGRMI